MYSVTAHTRPGGHCPYDDYVDGVSEAGQKKDAAKIDALVKELASVGAQQLAKMSKAEKMNDVRQLRPGRHRIFFFFDSDSQTYVLLNGFLKKSRRTPPTELARAEGLRSAYWSESKMSRR